MANAEVELHKNAQDRLPHLPEAVEFSNVAAFADGGTVCLCGRLPSDIQFRICLSPTDSVVFMGRPGRLWISEFHPSRQPYKIYEIVARSDLETQILRLMRSATCRSAETERVRDRIVTFVESDRYVELYRATDENPTTAHNGVSNAPIRGTPTPGLVVIGHGASNRSDRRDS